MIEYHIFTFHKLGEFDANEADKILEECLNKCGKEGWRLIGDPKTLLNCDSYSVLFIMTRDVPKQSWWRRMLRKNRE